MTPESTLSLKTYLASNACLHPGITITLSSGRQSKGYVDVKYALGNAKQLSNISEWVLGIMRQQGCNYIGGISLPGAVVVGAVLQKASICGYPYFGFMCRSEPHPHGLAKSIEGIIPPRYGHAILFEDVLTTGNSVITAARLVEEQDCRIAAICALVDREAEGNRRLTSLHYPLYTFTTLSELKEIQDETGRTY